MSTDRICLCPSRCFSPACTSLHTRWAVWLNVTVPVPLPSQCPNWFPHRHTLHSLARDSSGAEWVLINKRCFCRFPLRALSALIWLLFMNLMGICSQSFTRLHQAESLGYLLYLLFNSNDCEDIYHGNRWRKSRIMIVIMKYISGEPISDAVKGAALNCFHFSLSKDCRVESWITLTHEAVNNLCIGTRGKHGKNTFPSIYPTTFVSV